jgi:sugar O-acyltransferase (sialic acid O-acetyltransferase NeuD family)
MQPLVLIGGGQHARVLAEAAATAGRTVAGFVDPNAGTVLERIGLRRFGADHAMSWVRHAELLLAFGSLGPGDRRAFVAEQYEADGWAFGTLVDGRALISPSATVGAGTVVMAGAIIQAGAVIGRHCIVNSGAIVEHDVRLGDHVQVAPGAVIGGGATIGDRSFVGLGATLRDHLQLGEGVTVGMGSVVVHDVAAHATVLGVPARAITHDMPGRAP